MSEQLDIFKRYPEAPGYQNRATSFAAAAAIAPRADVLRERVYQAILARASTADEAAARLGEDRLSVRPRTTELSKQGRIVDSGHRRPTAFGRMAIVWCVPAGAQRMAA
jgi:hypothetical protein